MLNRSKRWLAPLVALILLCVALVVSSRMPTTSIASPADARLMGAAAEWNNPHATARPAKAEPAPPTPTSAPPRIVLTTLDGAYTEQQIATLHDPAAEALRYVEERTGMRLTEPVTVTFTNERGCALSGVAYTDIRNIKLFVCRDITSDRAISVLAHEFAHQLAHDHYGEAHLRADLILSEGLAQWGAGKYKLGGHSDFRTLVRQQYPYDLLPLSMDSRTVDSFAIMRHLYDQWASYVEWIIATAGRDALDRLYIEGSHRQPGSAPYPRVLGMPLERAEQQWTAWIEQ